MDFTIKNCYDFGDLISIMEKLRAPDGCMWDREQTHKSIGQNVIEEAYEVADAIDKDDLQSLCEELGDLLLQVVFHSQIESENDNFSIDEVCDGICKKLILRHPHIFGDVKVSSSSEVLDNWEKIKVVEKGHSTATQAALAVPKSFPALLRSQKVQSRVAKSGFDYPDIQMAMSDLKSEVNELTLAIENNDSQNAFEELGDILFSAVNVSRFLKVDSELALTNSCEKFIERFNAVEELAAKKGIDMKKADISELNNLWGLAKTSGV